MRRAGSVSLPPRYHQGNEETNIAQCKTTKVHSGTLLSGHFSLHSEDVRLSTRTVVDYALYLDWNVPVSHSVFRENQK